MRMIQKHGGRFLAKIAKYNSKRDFDDMLEKLLNHTKYLTTDKDDDFLILCAGDTGTGKSMLALHAFDYYMKEHADIKYVGLTKGSFATGFKEVQKVPKGFKFLLNDEANINKRDALSKYNKDLLDLYYSCRGLNIVHWWNNPSVEMIDKPFIKDRVKGFILITTKDIDRPRVYYYFTKNSLLKILEKYKNLDIKTINKVKKKYALYKGWFRDYSGELKMDYLNKKNPRMIEKVDDFVAKYGDVKGHDDSLRINEVAEKTGYAKSTISEYMRRKIIPEHLYFKKNNSPVSLNFFKPEVVDFLLERANNVVSNIERVNNGLKKG